MAYLADINVLNHKANEIEAEQQQLYAPIYYLLNKFSFEPTLIQNVYSFNNFELEIFTTDGLYFTYPVYLFEGSPEEYQPRINQYVEERKFSEGSP